MWVVLLLLERHRLISHVRSTRNVCIDIHGLIHSLELALLWSEIDKWVATLVISLILYGWKQIKPNYTL
jgi:hypothetical protein